MASMVLMPSTIKVRVMDTPTVDEHEVVRFQVLTEEGGPAIDQGLLFLDRG